MRRRKFQGQEWAARDTYWIGAFCALLLFGAVDEKLFYAALLLALAFLLRLAVRALRRRRAEQANDGKPSWIDEIQR